MAFPIYAYIAIADEQAPEQIYGALQSLPLNEAWIRVRPLGLQHRGQPLLMIELIDLASGGPVDAEGIGQRFSEDSRTVWLVAVDPTGQGAAFEVFRDGSREFAWGGPFKSFELELSGRQLRDREGFLEAFAELAGLEWNTLIEAAAKLPRETDLADGHTDLLLRGRILGLPTGMPRWPELFHLHYAAEPGRLEEVEPGTASEAEDQLMLVMLDPELLAHLWRGEPAAQVSGFLRAIQPTQRAVLGPLAHALPYALEAVLANPPEQSLASSPSPDLLAYEVLAIATAVGFGTGDAVSYYDRVFFPLLSLSELPLSAAVLESSLEEIRGLNVLEAMVEVLPYAAPEGELLESFADEEVAPLAAWASGGVYEGSVFLLDTGRLRTLVDRFDVTKFQERVGQFLALWREAQGEEEELDEREELDQPALELFLIRLEELKLLLALSEVNRLQAAVFFYGK